MTAVGASKGSIHDRFDKDQGVVRRAERFLQVGDGLDDERPYRGVRAEHLRQIRVGPVRDVIEARGLAEPAARRRCSSAAGAARRKRMTCRLPRSAHPRPGGSPGWPASRQPESAWPNRRHDAIAGADWRMARLVTCGTASMTTAESITASRWPFTAAQAFSHTSRNKASNRAPLCAGFDVGDVPLVNERCHRWWHEPHAMYFSAATIPSGGASARSRWPSSPTES
jgi:hypothetical protein